MTAVIATYTTESAAWLAGARVAANGGTADTHVRAARDRRTFALFAPDATLAAEARVILASFDSPARVR